MSIRKYSSLILRSDPCQICKENFFDVLIRYFFVGRLVDPSTVNLQSFVQGHLSENGFECTGNSDEFSMCCAERYFPRNSKTLIGTEFKVYFFRGAFWTNGFGIFSPVRLVSILEKMFYEKERKNIFFPLSLYFDEQLEQGGMVLSNGVVVRFNISKHYGRSNYYIVTVESNYSAIDGLNTRDINLRAVESVFTKFTFQDMQHSINNAPNAFRRLCTFFEKKHVELV